MSSTMVKDYYKNVINLNEEYLVNLDNLLSKLERGRSDGSIDSAMQCFHQIELVVTRQKIEKLRNELSQIQSESKNDTIDQYISSPSDTSGRAAGYTHRASSSTIDRNDVHPQLHFGEDSEPGVHVEADSPPTPNQQDPRPPAPLYSLLDVEFGPTGMVCVKKMNGAIFEASGYNGIWLLRRSDSTRHFVSDTPESHLEPESPDAQSTKTDEMLDGEIDKSIKQLGKHGNTTTKLEKPTAPLRISQTDLERVKKMGALHGVKLEDEDWFDLLGGFRDGDSPHRDSRSSSSSTLTGTGPSTSSLPQDLTPDRVSQRKHRPTTASKNSRHVKPHGYPY